MSTPQQIDVGRVAWHVSTRISNGSGNCVEVGSVVDGSARFAVRHSHHPDGRVIACSRGEWDAFLAGIKNGAHDFT